MTPVTRLLEAANSGDRQEAAELLPVVYAELRQFAAAKLAREQAGHSLDATALVHEAFLKLVGDQKFDGRGHFFAAAAARFSYFSYNFCWCVRTLRVKGDDGRYQGRTPAMAAGLTDHVWSIREWISFPAVQRQ